MVRRKNPKPPRKIIHGSEMPQSFLKLGELAEYLGVSTYIVRILDKQGMPNINLTKAFDPSGKTRYNRQTVRFYLPDVIKWLREKSENGNTNNEGRYY